ncbi:MAG: class I SAM-dependent methyltransferase [Solirubrobacterales bacterium]
MNTDEAILALRADPTNRDLIHWSYLGPDTAEAATRFAASEEFAEADRLVGGFPGKEVLDLGAGTGIASVAIARAGATRVYALEPDPSDVVGRGAIARIAGNEPIEILDAAAERIPLPDASVDVVYARQMLHHVPDLEPLAREVRRVLRPGGPFLACREHVVDDDDEMERFLAEHPVHRLAGGEGAHTLDGYLSGLAAGGLEVQRVWATYDSIINAFPIVQGAGELKKFRRWVVGPPLAALGPLAAKLPVTSGMVRKRFAPYIAAGRMYTFLARAS